jgi:hypothetical protein
MLRRYEGLGAGTGLQSKRFIQPRDVDNVRKDSSSNQPSAFQSQPGALGGVPLPVQEKRGGDITLVRVELEDAAAYPRHRRDVYSVSTPLSRRSCFCPISAARAIGYKKFYLENPARSFSIVHYHS